MARWIPKSDQVIDTIQTGGGLEPACRRQWQALCQWIGKEGDDPDQAPPATRWTPIRRDSDSASRSHLAIDTQAHRLFVSCINKVMTIVNADNMAQWCTHPLPIGQSRDSAALVLPKRKLAFIPNGTDEHHQRDPRSGCGEFLPVPTR